MVGLTELAGLYYLAANTLAVVAGTIVVYLAAVYWVFLRRRVQTPGLELGLFALIGVGGLGVNSGALWLLTETGGLHYAASKIGAAGASFLFNFLLRKFVLFR